MVSGSWPGRRTPTRLQWAASGSYHYDVFLTHTQHITILVYRTLKIKARTVDRHSHFARLVFLNPRDMDFDRLDGLTLSILLDRNSTYIRDKA